MSFTYSAFHLILKSTYISIIYFVSVLKTIPPVMGITLYYIHYRILGQVSTDIVKVVYIHRLIPRNILDKTPLLLDYDKYHV
jgi:hypothetical protein